jgi:hypothetical protein
MQAFQHFVTPGQLRFGVEEMISNGMLSECGHAELGRPRLALRAETHAVEAFMACVGARRDGQTDHYPEKTPRAIDADGDIFIDCDAGSLGNNPLFINHLAPNGGPSSGRDTRQGILRQSPVRLSTLPGTVHP